MEIVNLDAYGQNKKYYLGNAGGKHGITINGVDWMVKFPKSTRQFEKTGVSYTTSPISEFIGSHIYEILGIPVHETFLGFREGKIVCACKDMRRTDADWVEFKAIKNAYLRDDDLYSDSGTSGEGTALEDVLNVIKNNSILQSTEGITERFWDMFVVDAFIRNGDRNNTNWGIYVYENGTSELIPVYDNGNAFFNNRNEEQNRERLLDEKLLEQDAFGTYRSRFLDNEGHSINPFELIKKGEIKELKEAVDRFVSNINFQKIDELIDSIPESYQGKSVLPAYSKQLYKAILQKHYFEGIYPYSSFAEEQGLDSSIDFQPKKSIKEKMAQVKDGWEIEKDGQLFSKEQDKSKADNPSEH